MPRFETLLARQEIERYSQEGHWPNRLLTDYLDAAAQATPDRIAIIDSRRAIDYRALQALVDRCAHGLLALGLRPGDVLSIQLPNWIEFAVAHLAATRIGVVTCLITPIHRDREVAFMLNLAEATLALVPAAFRGYDYAAMMRRLRTDVPTLRQVMVVGGTAEGMLDWDGFATEPWEARSDARDLAQFRPDANDVTEIAFTSGTTGEPKGVLHTNNTILAPQAAMGRSLRLAADSVLHVATTMGHQTGFLGGVRLPIQWGTTIVYQDVWNPEQFIELIERHRISVTNGNATFLLDMLRARNLGQHDLSSFRIFRAGGGPIPQVLVREACEKLPHATILRGWGQTENGVVTLTRHGDPEDKLVGTDGCAQPGMEVRVVDAANRPLAPGVEGKLQCRGPFQFVGYLKQPQATRESYVGGWFDTGDFAVMDAEGYICIAGRAKDVIIRGGEKVPVKYVEDVLYECDLIQDAALVAMPDPRLGEKACAFVICREGRSLSLPDMQRFLENKGVTRQYWPERIEICTELPRAANGKIRKADLRERIAAMVAQEQSLKANAAG